MHRLLWSGVIYALAAAVLVVGTATPEGHDARPPRAFGLYANQSPFALSAALPALGIASYVSVALIDLAG